ncbi:MAG TPA: ABC transporter permease [Chloroflexota bacterium]|jgi:ABC-type nitrate/sulfonate/bicarbonate transport system permease component
MVADLPLAQRAAEPAPPLGRRVLDWLERYYSVVVVLAAWELLAHSGWVNPRLFPSLETIAEELWRLIESGAIYRHLLATLYRVVAGFGLAAIVGVVLGFLMARVQLFDRLFEPLFSFGYPIPRAALYPVFVFLFGLGHLSKIVLIFLECLYPIAINTYYGTRAVNERYVWAARNMGASGEQVFRKVIAPAALPQIFAGLRIALPVALVIAILTEMIGATEGLGYLIARASASLSRGQVFAGVAAIAVIGFVLDRALGWLRRRLVFWEKESISIG